MVGGIVCTAGNLMPFILATWIATFFRIGNSPVAPGTCGSLIVLPIVYALLAHTEWLWIGLCALIVLSTLLGAWATGVYLAQSGKEDPSEIVIDEVAGQAIALGMMLGYAAYSGVIAYLMLERDLPLTLDQAILALFLLAFILFRLFDISKPGPVGWCDRQLKGAWGVMADDLVAGVLAGGVGVGILSALKEWF